jgi:hypothetical protein
VVVACVGNSDFCAGADSCDKVVDLFLERAVCKVGAEEVVEVSDAGAGDGCDRSAAGGA